MRPAHVAHVPQLGTLQHTPSTQLAPGQSLAVVQVPPSDVPSHVPLVRRVSVLPMNTMSPVTSSNLMSGNTARPGLRKAAASAQSFPSQIHVLDPMTPVTRLDKSPP